SQVSSRANVASNDFNSSEHVAQPATWSRTAAFEGALGSNRRSGRTDWQSLQFIEILLTSVLRTHLNKILQLIPKRLVGAKEQRFCGGLAKFQDFADLFVVHTLVLMHQHRHALPLRQRHHMFANRVQPFLPQ